MKVLLVTYYFPPLSGAGISRPLSLFKYLPEQDVDCEVLTVKAVAYRYFEPELLDGLDLRKIHRSRSWDPLRIMRLFGMKNIKNKTAVKGRKAGQNLFPDPQVGWVRSAVKLGRVLIENRQYDAIISTSPPISAHLVGMKLAEEFKIPWIADFRDYWTSYKIENWYDDHRKIKKGKALLKKISEKADKIITVNEDIKKYIGRGEVIRNSYDHQRAKLWRKPEISDNIHIGILGTLDKLTPLKPLLRFLKQFSQDYPDYFHRLRISHVGSLNIDNIEQLLDKYGMSEKFESFNHRGRSETIELLNETSIMYLGISSEAGIGNTTSRIFDLFASGRPLLASVAEESEAASLINDYGRGCFIDPPDFTQSAKFMIECFENKIDIIPNGWGKHSSQNMVKQFTEILNDLKN